MDGAIKDIAAIACHNDKTNMQDVVEEISAISRQVMGNTSAGNE